MMLSCKQTALLLSQGQDRDLAFGERLALRVHLVICKGCRNVDAQFRFLRRAIGELGRHPGVDFPEPDRPA
jgi:hypothetical protein